MPRCFLAKKSTSVNNGLHWGPEDVTNNNHHHDEQQQQESLAHRPSTIGSISAAKAVLSIQEPICPPPAHQASILASSASASAVVKAAAFLKEPNNNNRATHWPRASTEQQPLRPLIMTSSRPPRRKKPAQRQPLNLTLGEGKELGLKNGASSALTTTEFSTTTVIPPNEIKIEPALTNPEPNTTPLPPEILANIQPHPPSCLDIKPVPCPVVPVVPRIRTKEETDAAHDLLELSRSLPPLPGPSQVTLHPAHPPTPPTPEDHNGQQYTLIYITTPNNKNEPPRTPEYPLTPPEFPHDNSSNSSIGSSPELSIVDGRTKKSKNPGLVTAAKDKSKYTCSECGKNYATSSNLSRHKQTHRSLDSNNAKKCHVCGKMYVSMPALSMHILTHNLSHRCNVCGKAFSRPWLLQGHMRSHTGHKPYSCTVCKKSFADRSNLRAHMQTHSPSKNFQCSRCHKTFALKSYLNKHYESSCVRSSSSTSSSSPLINEASSSGRPQQQPI